MAQIVDRRLNGKNKSAVNRQKFLRRFRKQIKKSVEHIISKRSVTDLDKGEKISIPNKDTSEPFFHHAQGGQRDMVHPGNKEFHQGDKIPRPKGGSGQGEGSEASDTGEGEDDFVFELSREEFLQFFFEDLELPDLVKTKLSSIIETKKVRAGHTSEGTPSNINVVRSLTGAMGRRMALRAPYKKELKIIEPENPIRLLSIYVNALIIYINVLKEYRLLILSTCVMTTELTSLCQPLRLLCFALWMYQVQWDKKKKTSPNVSLCCYTCF